MSSLNISQDELKSLEQARQRLITLIASINSMKEILYRSDPLPPPATLDKQNFILAKNIDSLLGVAKDNADLFSRIVVHPSTNFPGREHEQILQQLLRKKPEPDVEANVEAAREAAAAAGIGPINFVTEDTARNSSLRRKGAANYDSDSDDDEEYGGPEEDEYADEDGEGGQKEPLGPGDLWHTIRMWSIERLGIFGSLEEPKMFTPEERAMGVGRVRTGLKRNLAELEPDEGEGEDEDEDDDEEGGEGEELRVQHQARQPHQPPAQQTSQDPSMDTEYLLWFGGRGDLYMPMTIDRLSDTYEHGKRVVGRRK